MEAVKSDNEIRIYNAYLHRDSIKQIEGKHYDECDKAWSVPLTEENIKLLELLGCSLDEPLKAIVIADAESNDEQPLMPMPIRASPYRHQVRAYNFALKIFGKGGDVK